MAGLVPAIPFSGPLCSVNRDARDKRGHDGGINQRYSLLASRHSPRHADDCVVPAFFRRQMITNGSRNRAIPVALAR